MAFLGHTYCFAEGPGVPCLGVDVEGLEDEAVALTRRASEVAADGSRFCVADPCEG